MSLFENIFVFIVWLLMIITTFTFGVYAIVKRHSQIQYRFGLWGLLDTLTKNEQYIDFDGWKAVVFGILSIAASLILLILPFKDVIQNSFKPGYIDQSGVKHILVKPDDFCGMKMAGGGIATCPNNYFCGPNDILTTTGVGLCLPLPNNSVKK